MSKANAARAVLAAFLFTAAAVAAAAEHAHTVNKTIPFPKTNRAELGWKVGPITFTEVIVRNAPNDEDLREAKKDTNDNCHPKLQVGVSNGGDQKMKFHLTVALEDDQGSIYLSCDRNDSIKPGAENDHTNLCWLDSMKTIDWPKLTRIRIKADVDPD